MGGHRPRFHAEAARHCAAGNILAPACSECCHIAQDAPMHWCITAIAVRGKGALRSDFASVGRAEEMM